jgi:hypothetical protein
MTPLEMDEIVAAADAVEDDDADVGDDLDGGRKGDGDGGAAAAS